MYLEVLADLAAERGWALHTFEAKDVVRQAAAVLGDRADELLLGARALYGAPWTKDHQMALAATVLAG
jgi:hypothetical protein